MVLDALFIYSMVYLNMILVVVQAQQPSSLESEMCCHVTVVSLCFRRFGATKVLFALLARVEGPLSCGTCTRRGTKVSIAPAPVWAIRP